MALGVALGMGCGAGAERGPDSTGPADAGSRTSTVDASTDGAATGHDAAADASAVIAHDADALAPRDAAPAPIVDAAVADGSVADGAMADASMADASVRDAAVSPDADSSAPSGDAGESPYVTVCGTSLCLGGAPFHVKRATAYGAYDDPSAEVSAAIAAHLNTIEIVEFETQFHTLSDTMSERTWTRVDKMVDAARTAGLHVIFNLSSYGQSLEAAGQTATTVDWGSYLSFIANRQNTVNHVTYKDDPTIAMFELFGEIPQPTGTGTNGTPQEMTAFYHRTLGELATLAPNHLRSSGGFSYLDEPNSAGIDWKTIMTDPLDQVCAVEVNSSQDRNTTVPMVSSYCKGLGKPWFLAAWSACVGSNPTFSGDLDNYSTDALAAAHALDMYAVDTDTNASTPAPAMASIGSDFWNLGSGSAPTCNINPSFPKTYAVVQGAR
jgi:hypothetical protein